MANQLKKATFGAGCFWGVQEAFRNIPGVVHTTVGFMGGHVKDPTYEQVCRKNTGHAEVLRLEYDPKIISYEKLLDIFWDIHDPTQLDRQGPDIGSQYRSVIFYHSKEQEQTALKSKKKLETPKIFKKKIATLIEPAQDFYRAEDYHQNYLHKKNLKTCG